MLVKVATEHLSAILNLWNWSHLAPMTRLAFLNPNCVYAYPGHNDIVMNYKYKKVDTTDAIGNIQRNTNVIWI